MIAPHRHRTCPVLQRLLRLHFLLSSHGFLLDFPSFGPTNLATVMIGVLMGSLVTGKGTPCLAGQTLLVLWIGMLRRKRCVCWRHSFHHHLTDDRAL